MKNGFDYDKTPYEIFADNFARRYESTFKQCVTSWVGPPGP